MPCLGKGGKAVKKPQNRKMGSGPLFVIHHRAMEIYCICMFYLNDQTDCPILLGIHKVYTYDAYRYTVQNMYINI